MAKKRKTLKEKKMSVKRKGSGLKNIKEKKKIRDNVEENILAVEEKYIRKDLLKTLITSVIFILFILGLAKYLG